MHPSEGYGVAGGLKAIGNPVIVSLYGSSSRIMSSSVECGVGTGVKQLRIVSGWLALHEDELYKAWNCAVAGMPFDKISPLA